LIKTLAFIADKILQLLLFSCRIRVHGAENLLTAKQGRSILALWHEHLAPMLALLSKVEPTIPYLAVVSNSRDGALLSALVQVKKYAVAKVPHDSRHQALRSILNAIGQGLVPVITPDGPRGPARQVKNGIAFLSLKSQAPIIPISWTASKTWKLRSWDRMQIPKPFSTIDLTFGKPIIPPDSISLEDYRCLIEKTLLEAEALPSIEKNQKAKGHGPFESL
jgi:lysophospholipid acyltransferase (LPLAT)-like uncharacterized protein